MAVKLDNLITDEQMTWSNRNQVYTEDDTMTMIKFYKKSKQNTYT